LSSALICSSFDTLLPFPHYVSVLSFLLSKY
jgi:hypothetical protein